MSKRRVLQLVGLVVYATLGYLAAKYLAGCIYFVANKAMPVGIELGTWAIYWEWYSDIAVQRKRLQFAAGAAAIIVFVVPPLIVASLLAKTRSLHGDARFARADEVRASGLLGSKGIIVGRFGDQYLIMDGQQFVLLAAPTRSGKGVGVVVPNLLHFEDSAVVIDIKLENFLLTSKFRQTHGQQVYLFAPFSETGTTHRWNPLDTIRRDKNLRVGDVQAMAQILWPSADGNEKDKFWNDNARSLFQAFALYLIDTPDLPCTFGEIFRQASGKGRPPKDHIQGLLSGRSNGPTALSEECLDAFSRFLAAPENTLGSILSTFNAPLLTFSNPLVDAATSGTDFDLDMVRKVRMTVYFGVLPDKLPDAALLINLFFSQLINLNIRELPEMNPALKYQCLLVLDEFTALGKVAVIAKANAFIAGYGIRLLTIIQSVAQLERVYGKEGTRELVTNHAAQILYPPREQKDANEYSEMLGYFTAKGISKGTSTPRAFGSSGSNSVNESDQKRALMLPQELKTMGKSKEIVIVEDVLPILCDKARYYDDWVFIKRLQALSPTLQKCGRRLPTRNDLINAAFVRLELSVEVPAVDVDMNRAVIEKRIRPLRADEELDLAKLAVDLADLPTIADPDHPTKEEATAIVDSFFASLDWVDADGVISGPPGPPIGPLGPVVSGEDGGAIEQGLAHGPGHDAALAGGVFASAKTSPTAGALDLAVLDS